MDEPRYNIRAVERMTGVRSPTLRSWERRYGFPAPSRTDTARRLYSDREVNAIRWVKGQLDRGLSVAQAIRWLQSGGPSTTGVPPPTAAATPDALFGRNGGSSTDARADQHTDAATAPPAGGDGVTGGSLSGAASAFVAAVRMYDEGAAERALSAAFARYPTDLVITDMITPALIEIGERWALGELPVSAEHFASSIVRRRLFTLLSQQPVGLRRPVLVLGCVPGEQHEIGLLMLAVFLRGAGARVIYLGPDVPVEDLVACIRDTDADAVCLSAVDPS